ncbi:MAG: hypothetical protein AAF546_12790 [Verrucomicrobiota bacterium]
MKNIYVTLWGSLLFFAFVLIPTAAEEEEVFIAVVGGTTFGNPATFAEGLADTEKTFTIETEAGESPPIHLMRFKGVPFYYIRMYGYEAVQDGEPEYLAHIRTWLALYKLGVTHAIGGASSGGIRTDYGYDDLVIIDDYMDMESQRPQNILKYAGLERPGIFASFATPYSPSIRALLIDEAVKAQPGYSGNLYLTATFAQHNPGRFETAAEVRAMRILGADLCSENIATATTYARQLGIRFAAICSIANPAVGVRPFDFEDMQASVQRIAAQSIPIVLETIVRIPEEAMEPEPISTGDTYTGSYTDPDAETHKIVE